jgi:hypothetical protein
MKDLLLEVVKSIKEVLVQIFSEGYSLLKSLRH